MYALQTNIDWNPINIPITCISLTKDQKRRQIAVLVSAHGVRRDTRLEFAAQRLEVAREELLHLGEISARSRRDVGEI